MRLLITLGRESRPKLAGIVSAVIWEFALLRHLAYSLVVDAEQKLRVGL